MEFELSKHTVMIIHGIGEHETGYSVPFQERLFREINSDKVQFIEIRYSHLLDRGIKEYNLNEHNIKELGSDEFRKLFNSTLYDAISYGYTRKSVFDYIDASIPEKIDNLTVIAHSLGGIVAYDWIYHQKENERNERKIKNFFTLGSPLALKMITRRHELRAEYWMNIVGEHDIIGKPMKISPADMKQVNRDYICPVGGFVQRRTPFCHTGYFDDDNVIKPIAKKIQIDLSGKKFSEKSYNKFVDALWKI
jgi:hypothetical protein